MARLLDVVKNAVNLPVFPIGGPTRTPFYGRDSSQWHDPEWLLSHADSWDSIFVLTGVDDIALCAAMAGPSPEGANPREYYRSNPVTTLADILKLATPDPLTDQHLALSLEVLSFIAKGPRPVLVSVWGPLTTAATLVGLENFLRATITNKRLIDSLIGKVTEMTIDYIDAAFEAGADFLWVAEPVACLFGNPLFEQVGIESLSKLFITTQSHDTEGILHVCGDTSHLTELLIDTGAKALSIDACVDLVDTACRCSDDTIIIGNLWPVDLLTCTDSELRAAAASMAQKMQGRPYIASTGCSIPHGVEPIKLAAFLDEARSHPGMAAQKMIDDINPIGEKAL